MEAFVVRITPRRIERLVFILVIVFFIGTTIHYANRYYDKTPEDRGYLDKLFSGTFIAKVPTEAELSATEQNTTAEIEEIIDEDIITTADDDPDENETSEKETTVEKNETADDQKEEPEEEEEIACTDMDFKLIDTKTIEDNDDDTNKEGSIEGMTLQFCNTDTQSTNMIAEIYIWDEVDKDNSDILNLRKKKPHFTTDAIKEIAPGEKYSTYFKFDRARSIYDDSTYYYMIKFYYSYASGEVRESTVVKAISSTSDI